MPLSSFPEGSAKRRSLQNPLIKRVRRISLTRYTIQYLTGPRGEGPGTETLCILDGLTLTVVLMMVSSILVGI